MKTLYIDINNKPIQETDEIKLFTDEGSLQYAFFYELGSQLVGKVGKSIKKAKLISDFNSPENAEAFQKIITQWNVLKAMLFGEELEETFDVVIPKEFISWMSVHVDNEYRCIAAQYDKTKDYTVTIDVESFFEDAVDDEFKRNIVKVLKSNSEIEQIVFNDDAVTKRSRIVKSIREKSEVVFVPFEKWNEDSEEMEEEERTSPNKSMSHNQPLVATCEKDLSLGGYRVLVSSLTNNEDVIFSGYYDESTFGESALFVKNNFEDNWTVITPYGISSSTTNNCFDVDILPCNKIFNIYENTNELETIILIKPNIILVSLRRSPYEWILHDFNLGESIKLIETFSYYVDRQIINNQIICLSDTTSENKKTIFYDFVNHESYDYVYGTFAIRITNINRCQVFSLKNGKRLLTDKTIIFVKEFGYDKPSKTPTIICSEDGALGAAFDITLNKKIVFDHDGNVLYLEPGEELIHKKFQPELCYFSSGCILIKKNHQLLIKDIRNKVLFSSYLGDYDQYIEIIGASRFGLVPCLCRKNNGPNFFTFIKTNRFICLNEGNNESDIINEKFNVTLLQDALKDGSYIVPSHLGWGASEGEIRHIEILSENLFYAIIDHSQYLFRIENSIISKLVEFYSIDYRDSDNIVVENGSTIQCYSLNGKLLSKFPKSYNNISTSLLKYENSIYRH